ncbi:MAG: HlyC/CorC family transporter [Methanomicrobiales archaeon]|nr:HlyC/CorC family transporter [Methanomicrobiales archaeon]
MIEENVKIALFIACILLSAFFSGSEVAILSINQAKVRTLLERNLAGAGALAALKKNTDHVLITILIGNNVVNVAAAALATSIAIERYGDAGVGIATGIVTFIMLVFGEIGPKTYAARMAEKFALIVSRPIFAFGVVLSPLLWVYDGIKKLLSIKEGVGHPVVTEDEIKQWIDVGEEVGTIQEEEHELLYRVFRFGDTITREIMTPRADVVLIADSSSLETSINVFNETGFSRIPVYEQQIDNIIGVLNVKDVFAAVYAKKKGVTVRDLMYEAYFVPESKKIGELLRELQLRKVHLAVVVDEYGSFAGIVTVEDMLEELVGEILDEFDEEEPQVQAIEEGVFIVDARSWVDRVNEEIGIRLPLDESYETIGGLLIDSLGHFPRRGEVVELPESGIRLVVMKVRGRRIVEVKLILPLPGSEENS